MAVLVWDELTSRRYEAGVSHGALYLLNSSGVAWNGLISVIDKSIGADQLALHQDGIKYYDLIGSRDYHATVSAFYSPREFASCTGEKELVPGIRLTRQPKSRFNFSYQTHSSEGYKIHLVYNVLATPTNKNHATQGAQANPLIFSWEFDAVPVAVPGFKPSAHYVVDSTKVNLVLLTELEAILYGTGINEPEFPTIEELITLFGVEIP